MKHHEVQGQTKAEPSLPLFPLGQSSPGRGRAGRSQMPHEDTQSSLHPQIQEEIPPGMGSPPFGRAEQRQELGCFLHIKPPILGGEKKSYLGFNTSLGSGKWTRALFSFCLSLGKPWPGLGEGRAEQYPPLAPQTPQEIYKELQINLPSVQRQLQFHQGPWGFVPGPAWPQISAIKRGTGEGGREGGGESHF